MSVFAAVECLPFPRSGLAEGITWDPLSGTLVWVDIPGRTAFRSHPSLRAASATSLPKLTSALLPGDRGGLLALCHDGLHAFDPGREEADRLVALCLPPGLAVGDVRFNDAKVDPAGRIWAGTMSLKGRTGAGALFRFEPPSQVTAVYHPTDLSNGIAWTPSGKHMCFIDSAKRCVHRFEFDLAAGRIVAELPSLDLSGEPGLPDGCSMDAEGMLWIAHWGGARITRRDPVKGRIIETIRLPVTNVTSLAFGGDGLRRLFVSTAGPEAAGAAAEPEAGCIFEVAADAAGLPQTLLQESAWSR